MSKVLARTQEGRLALGCVDVSMGLRFQDYFFTLLSRRLRGGIDDILLKPKQSRTIVRNSVSAGSTSGSQLPVAGISLQCSATFTSTELRPSGAY